MSYLPIPVRVRLVTLEEQKRLDELRAQVVYHPRAGFLKDGPKVDPRWTEYKRLLPGAYE